MNESTLTRLKIIVERAVRPVQASMPRKRQMREELLAHVCGVFEEEAARLRDDQVALERVALRFGNPAEVTGQSGQASPATHSLSPRLCGGRGAGS
jgi:ATP-dependent Clp protease ATP-binding subunit ClpC